MVFSFSWRLRTSKLLSPFRDLSLKVSCAPVTFATGHESQFTLLTGHSYETLDALPSFNKRPNSSRLHRRACVVLQKPTCLPSHRSIILSTAIPFFKRNSELPLTMRLSTLGFGVVLAYASTAVAQKVTPASPVPPQQSVSTAQGCYSSKGNMTLHSPVEGMSSAACNKACLADGYTLAGLHAKTQCFCGDAMPPKKASESDCDLGCPFYPQEPCGGNDAWSIFNLGVNVDPPVYGGSSSSATAASSSTAQTSATSSSTASSSDNEPTTVVTETANASASSKPEKSGGHNVAGIAAGVVVGVVAAAAIVGGVFFYIRRKRNAEIEEDHRRNAAVNAFISGSKPPSSSGSVNMTDSRLDPVMAHRRMSDGSIADNEDYSRRILRVSFESSASAVMF